MKHIISCRDTVYPTRQDAFRLLPDAGITHVELGGVEPAKLADVQKEAESHGIEVATVGSGVDLANPESVSTFRQLVDATGSAGIARMFASIGPHELQDRDACMAVLRGVADHARAAGVQICMETHPPFGVNAATALETIGAVASDALRLNYDSANIYYYNRNIDGIAELETSKHVVGSVHLKDTDGGFHSMNFPVFSEGIVDFRSVFRVLDDAGFDGPYTFELEGPLTHEKSTDERHASVKACAAYLRELGVM